MANQRKLIGRLPVFKGEWSSLETYNKLNEVTLYGSSFRSKIDGNTYKPAELNGEGTGMTVNENWYVVANGTDAYLAGEKIASIDGNTSTYNVSRFHQHTGFWEAVEYDDSEPAYLEAQEYTAGNRVNLVNYTNHTFVAMKSMTGVMPDYNNISNKFTLEEAILFVPSKYRLTGMNVGFLDSSNKPVVHKHKGGTFTNVANWEEDVQTQLTELSSKNYFFSDIPTDGNLIDQNKIINGYYVGTDGSLIENEDYGYTYIPMRGKNVTVNFNSGAILVAVDKLGKVTHSNTESYYTQKTIQYQEGDEYAAISVPLSILGKSASAEYGDEIPNYKDYGYTTNAQLNKIVGGTKAAYNTNLEVGTINVNILDNLNITKGSVFGCSVKSDAEWSRLLFQFHDNEEIESQRVDNIISKNGEIFLVNTAIGIEKLKLYCDCTKAGEIVINIIEFGEVLRSEIERIFELKYKVLDTALDGNLIDPRKVISGYYFGHNGKLEANESYGYTYIPMRGKNITINYNGGFKLSACNKYGSVTHTNTEIAQTVGGITIQYQEGDEYAMISVPLDILDKTASAEYGDVPTIYKPYNEHSGELIKDSSISSKKLDDSVIINKNLFNPDDPDYVEGYYLTLENSLNVNENYAVSGYIPFTQEMGKLVISRDGIVIADGGGGVGLYDIYKNKIVIEQNQNIKGVAIWQEGVAFVRFSINGYKNGNIQIEVGDVPTKYVSPNGIINPDLLQQDTKLDIVLSSLGNNADSVTKDTLNDSEILTLDNFPWHIKKRLIMSFSASITSFSSILIGKGLNQYRGDYLKIDSTNIIQLHYESSESEKEKVVHGLSINTFIKISLLSDNSGYLYVILQSKNGTFKYVFKSWAYEANYSAFVKSIGSTLTDLKFNAGSQDFKLPVWAFGDSYFGVSTNRWPGAIRDFGFFNFLIDGLAGQSSNGAYNDLVKCLQFGTPKYLLWCLGMNDADSAFKTIFNKVKVLCETKGITLIAATIPTVPNRPKEIISQYVKDSGLRYIDFYKAMGANSQGAWYEGYLSSDNVHPTELGAKVLAMQVLIDFPELMQYGLVSTDSEIGDITGDK